MAPAMKSPGMQEEEEERTLPLLQRILLDNLCSEFIQSSRVRSEKKKNFPSASYLWFYDTSFPEHLRRCHQIILKLIHSNSSQFKLKKSHSIFFFFPVKSKTFLVHIFSEELFEQTFWCLPRNSIQGSGKRITPTTWLPQTDFRDVKLWGTQILVSGEATRAFSSPDWIFLLFLVKGREYSDCLHPLYKLCCLALSGGPCASFMSSDIRCSTETILSCAPACLSTFLYIWKETFSVMII
ncbi:uncharacterized protein LOC125080510 [Lutra lutra]|uniref:uncharacterized protein LOC125080510 n=1 Tax=Lutra lutra TaxID=9657 RepID=UPI001FD5E2CD|nr:uncharacterized protein LOC125080510 [Lutra lutra]